MAMQTGTSPSRDTSVPVSVRKNDRQLSDRANDAVARRAYSLFLADGAADGKDMEHWLRAESEVLTHIPDIRESGASYTIAVRLPGFSPEEIAVNVDQNAAMIVADKSQTDGGADKGGISRESLFLVANWPTAVDPATANANLRDNNLTVTVKRTGNR
jgi:HSP20 family molecular chaperone IbpA